MPEGLPKDQLQHVSEISTELKDALQASRTSVDNIEELLKKIAYYLVIETDDNGAPLKRRDEDQGDVHETKDEEIQELERIKNENLQLLLDIQREEYIGRKWDTVLTQNEEILKSLVDWLKLNDSLSSVGTAERSHLEKIQLSVSSLNDDERASRHRIGSLMGIINELMEILDHTINDKEKIKETTNEMVKEINKLHNIYCSNKLN